ncbi:MAG: hypothetical protein Ct9H300mP10_04580 [Methanobacteriota archaeon]|nr:MAG: hypothetical protein Ct9H300mP10_04580 [Euryarchaeota archaeon]
MATTDLLDSNRIRRRRREGRFSFTPPCRKIRVSAFIGEPDLEAARSTIMMSE